MTNTLKTIADAKAIDALRKAIANGGNPDIRVIYDTTTEEGIAAANAAWEKASALATAAGLAIVAMPSAITVNQADGTTAEINPYEGNQTAIAGLMARVTVDGKDKNAVTALVRFPVPTVQAFIDETPDWLSKIVYKEVAHVAFRRLRDAENVEELTAGMESVPFTADDFAKNYSADRGGVDTSAFDTMWSQVRAMLLAKYPALDGALPSKAEVIKAIRSKAVAEESYPLLEQTNLFQYIGLSMVAMAPAWVDKDTGETVEIDASAISDWLANRDEWKPASKTVDKAAIAGLKFDIGV